MLYCLIYSTNQLYLPLALKIKGNEDGKMGQLLESFCFSRDPKFSSQHPCQVAQHLNSMYTYPHIDTYTT